MTSVTHKYYLYLTREVISHIGCRNAKSATYFNYIKVVIPLRNLARYRTDSAGSSCDLGSGTESQLLGVIAHLFTLPCFCFCSQHNYIGQMVFVKL